MIGAIQIVEDEITENGSFALFRVTAEGNFVRLIEDFRGTGFSLIPGDARRLGEALIASANRLEK